MPNMRTVRTTPPAPGSSPSLTSGKPSLTFGSSSATRWWQARQISRPPPSAAPLIATATGFPSVSSRRSCFLPPRTISAICGASSLPAARRSLRSPPAKKVFFAEAITTPVIESFSASRRSIAAAIDSA